MNTKAAATAPSEAEVHFMLDSGTRLTVIFERAQQMARSRVVALQDWTSLSPDYPGLREKRSAWANMCRPFGPWIFFNTSIRAIRFAHHALQMRHPQLAHYRERVTN